MNDDLTEALITSNDCTCLREIHYEGNERLPRTLRVKDPSCPDHGDNAARVAPPLEVVSDAWSNVECVIDHAREVNVLRDAAATIRQLPASADPATFLNAWADRLDHSA